eukprot:11838466-Alexandrium_andersonii.AAC.1
MTKACAEAVAAGECVVLAKERLQLKVRILWRDGRADNLQLPAEPEPGADGECAPERPWWLECLQRQQ